mmetsp:Transcript_16273/g.28587  ORF Transcript_16273/g.28587 Transcript_16273/m.28587 type:complete len:216 (-) Transcript_16273:1584-2231(-)
MVVRAEPGSIFVGVQLAGEGHGAHHGRTNGDGKTHLGGIVTQVHVTVQQAATRRVEQTHHGGLLQGLRKSFQCREQGAVQTQNMHVVVHQKGRTMHQIQRLVEAHAREGLHIGEAAHKIRRRWLVIGCHIQAEFMIGMILKGNLDQVLAAAEEVLSHAEHSHRESVGLGGLLTILLSLRFDAHVAVVNNASEVMGEILHRVDLVEIHRICVVFGR